jgi:hypothetical protein
MYTPLPTPDRPWESISMDYMSGLPSTKRGNDCVFVVFDLFSKMVIMVACKKSITAEATAKIFFEQVWVHFGIPQTIISYRDSWFLNTFWSSLWSLLDTKLTNSTAFHPQMDGQTKVVNRMIVHILCMYNSKHPAPRMRVFPMFNTATTNPYISQLTTTPFRWGWDFNHWVPWMLHYPLRPPRKTRHMLQLELTKPPGSLRRSITSTNRFMIFYRSPMPSTSNSMINTGCHTSFRWETKFGCTCRKNSLQGLIGSFIHYVMDPTPSPRLVGDNYFELNLPPFLGLHPIFNVDLLRPYFPPLLDTSEIEEQLTPIELNPDCMEHESTDHIMDT